MNKDMVTNIIVFPLLCSKIICEWVYVAAIDNLSFLN